MPKEIAPKVLSWASAIDENTIEQAARSAQFDFIPGHIALMPDAHFGYGVTIGSVIPTRGAIIPYAVGVDIGCGMAALRLGVSASDLPDDLGPLLSAIEQAIPAGKHSEPTDRAFKFFKQSGEMRNFTADWIKTGKSKVALEQFGTLGGGNHFVELCVDTTSEDLWLVLHSGSRGIGNQLAQFHINKAKGLMKQYFITLDDPNLAYIPEDTPEFEAYWADLTWAQLYAKENRSAMLSASLKAFREFIGRDELKPVYGVNCHHNYTALEHHHGKNLYITRKGAISAKTGQLGIIPGSMGTNSYIVRGLGNKASYNSAPHGAGRKMSRKKARQEFTVEDFADQMGDRTWLASKANKLLDEHPGAYKDIAQVIADSAELVEVEHELTQILNYKGTR